MKRLLVIITLVVLAMTAVGWGVIGLWKQETAAPRVARGVFILDRQIGGLEEWDVRNYLLALEPAVLHPPVQPVVDPRTKGIVPGISGKRLNVELTLSAALSAPVDSVVELVWEEILPEPPTPGFPIFQGNPAKKQIALVINVAWGNTELVEILEILERHTITASFFLVGRWADAFPELVREIHKYGHELGNHAYSDPHLPKLSAKKIAEEIIRTTAAIQAAVGETPVEYFSPPYNDYNQVVLEVAAELGYTTVLCSLDTADWLRPGVERIVRRIVPKAHNGAIVLMHPTEQTPAALELIIPGLLDLGYDLVTVGQLLSPKP